MTASDDLDFTAEERKAIEELKERLSQEVNEKQYEDTFMFYRFLKARNFDINQAEIMLKKHLQWRKTYGVDTILTDYTPPEVLEKYIGFKKFGFDRDGSICRYVPLANYDSKGLHMSAKQVDLEKYIIQVIEMDEKLQRAKNKKGKLPGYFFIYNMKNLPFALATDKKGVEDLIRVGKIFQDHYPEKLKAVYFINVSAYFSVPFSIIKSFLDANVLKKIHLRGSDDWQEEIIDKLVDAEQFPAFLGGKMTDPDGNPMCNTIVNHAGPIPEKYYMKKDKNSLSQDPKCKKLSLPRASFSEISLEIKIPGSLIEWEFESKTRDIGFGVFHKEGDGDDEVITELVPLLRMETNLFSETGMYKCEKAGTYILLFDNSYSWIRSKEILYKATVVTPKDHEAQLEKKC